MKEQLEEMRTGHTVNVYEIINSPQLSRRGRFDSVGVHNTERVRDLGYMSTC